MSEKLFVEAGGKTYLVTRGVFGTTVEAADKVELEKDYHIIPVDTMERGEKNFLLWEITKYERGHDPNVLDKMCPDCQRSDAWETDATTLVRHCGHCGYRDESISIIPVDVDAEPVPTEGPDDYAKLRRTIEHHVPVTGKAVDVIVAIMVGVCHWCYEDVAGCHCMNDE